LEPTDEAFCEGTIDTCMSNDHLHLDAGGVIDREEYLRNAGYSQEQIDKDLEMREHGRAIERTRRAVSGH
jgi:hypothetical protein